MQNLALEGRETSHLHDLTLEGRENRSDAEPDTKGQRKKVSYRT